MAGNIPPFAQSGFSFDPNLSPNNGNFAAAVRAVMTLGGYPIPGGGATATGTSLPATVFANPTNKVSLLATNGTSTLAMRSDGAPALDVSISPTWSGQHIWSGTLVPLVVSTNTVYGWGGGGGGIWGPVLQAGMAGGINWENVNPSIRIWAGCYWNGTSVIFTGTGTNNVGTSSAIAVVIGAGEFLVQAGGTGTFGGTGTLINIFAVSKAAPTLQGYGVTAGSLVDVSGDTGTVTLTQTGGTTAPTVVAIWSKQGNQVMITIPAFGAMNSNSTSLTFTGLPAEIQPSRTQHIIVAPNTFINGGAQVVNGVSCELTAASGTIQCLLNGVAAGWTNSATAKGLNNIGIVLQYMLN